MISSNTTIFSDDDAFEKKVFEVFEFQYINNLVFRRFCDFFGKTPLSLEGVLEIPLLPIEAFRDVHITSMPRAEAELVFRSSGTTHARRSVHYVASEEMYCDAINKGINYFYPMNEYVVWGYTPGYDENPDSSLVWMLRELIRKDRSGLSHFLSLGTPLKNEAIGQVLLAKKQIILFGAAFGLLDLVNQHPAELPPGSIVIETGGMKTNRRHMSREDLHHRLADGFGIDRSQVHSEYGMTELMSQAYARGGSWFECPPWMRITVRDPSNPFAELPLGEEGLLGIIDLANFYSCSFLLTGDKGIARQDGAFQVNGRFENRNLRGCNFLIDRE